MTVPSTERISSHIPITVFTGFLGAGKTSIILSLLRRLPPDYQVVLLKNEFGDVEVDSQLAKQSSMAAVSEILNGCMCCVLVGQMKTSLLEIREKYRPDRIIIECSGSAFPATLAFQIRELERETASDLKLDAIITVVDAENFIGYEDTSPTAKMQASYTDAILINKSEHISERALDILVDHLNTLNEMTPKIRCKGREGVDPALIFGLDSKLFQAGNAEFDALHHDEVETVTVYRGRGMVSAHSQDAHHRHLAHCNCDDGTTAIGKPILDGNIKGTIEQDELLQALQSLSKETVWRVKGFVRLGGGTHILNWAFGRYDVSESLTEGLKVEDTVRLTVMGERGEVKRAVRKFAERIGGCII